MQIDSRKINDEQKDLLSDKAVNAVVLNQLAEGVYTFQSKITLQKLSSDEQFDFSEVSSGPVSIILSDEACKSDLDHLITSVMQMDHEREIPFQMMHENDKELIVVVQ